MRNRNKWHRNKASGKIGRDHHRLALHKPPVGASPGTLVQAGEANAVSIVLTAYSEHELAEQEIDRLEQLRDWMDFKGVVWVDVRGVTDLDALRQIADLFELHPLVLEDIAHVHQRPKLESYPDHLFVVTRIPNVNEGTLTEQVSLLLGNHFIITFQERVGDCFDNVRQRIRTAKGRIRCSGSDYLAYALIDAATDAYFPLLESYADNLDVLENTVMRSAERLPIERLHALKRDLSELRRAIWPQRDMLGMLQRDDSGLIGDDLHTYLRDCQDHSLQLLDIIETCRETAGSLMELYLSSINLRMNETMKVLTMIATIFIPLSFIASVYGMNFDGSNSPFNMPELGWYYGYLAVLLLMLSVFAGFLVFFIRRGWIGGQRRSDQDSG
ncbi:magnesium transporter [Methylohalomonas lacus]|uniref:Magnesium transport protein CorA n=1 Tax=Methylohalomonas lacus TaxID=398773 RepID=A0AAE3HLW0_9GAMM|nr:magnesium/cobalt transporter CorA [Methylohalomonas lacus]MCS3902848.1 magnesium transporter [Methylohalomonas lacus]